MFKSILRTLSALSITTISLIFGVGFAQADIIKECTGADAEYCSVNERFCAADPFSTMVENGETCIDVLGSDYRTALVRFCGKPANKDNSGCISVLNKPNAANWSHNALEGTVDVWNGTNLKNQFLQGKESGLLTNGAIARGNSRITFRNRIDGVAYFYTETNSKKHFYAGILSGTDLGELVTEVAGLAVWSGTFGAIGDNHALRNVPFELAVDFGNKKLTAFIRKSSGTTPSSGGDLYFSIDGSIESGAANTGLITGKVDFGRFLMNDKTQPIGELESATLSGLIGTKGAVGVFVSDDEGSGSPTHTTYGHFSGGFIASPPSEAEKRTLLSNCGTNPFNSVCFSDTTYNATREAECLHEPSLPKCIFTVTRVCDVEQDPFNPLCKAEKYRLARADRVELCNGNTEDPLCKDTFINKICAYDPFSAICFNGGATPQDRARKITRCESADSNDLSCNTARKRPNVANWINSFAEAGTPLLPGRDTADPKNEFLKDTLKGLKPQGTKRFNRFNYPAIVSNLNLSTATFGGTALGGDVKNGVSFFRGWDSTHRKYLHYASVWSGTDLGAPVSGTIGKAAWVGHFETAGFYAVSQTDFILEVNFDSGSSGSIKAFVPYSGDQFFSLDGTFDASGLIEGTSELAYFRNQNRELKDESKASNTGLLRGLIGSNGALGVFRSDEIGALNGKHAYSGGFVARVNDNINHILTVLDACDTNPFGPLCNLDYETERADTINLCIEGDTMLTSPDVCMRAVARHPCIENPFAEECVTDFAQYYEAAQAERIAFCNSNASHPHCAIALERPNAATWANSFTSTPLNTTATAGNKFLQIADRDIGVGIVQANSNGTGTPTVRRLDFTAFSSGIASGLDADDGFAHFIGYIGGTAYAYAGIYDTTNLGAPITDDTLNASWTGKIRLNQADKDFTLDVTFNGTNGTANAFIVDILDSSDLRISGEFDAKGVITGDIYLGAFPGNVQTGLTNPNDNGTLSGIIGQQGAVGAFIGDSGNSASHYSGGFVAAPTQ